MHISNEFQRLPHKTLFHPLPPQHPAPLTTSHPHPPTSTSHPHPYHHPDRLSFFPSFCPVGLIKEEASRVRSKAPIHPSPACHKPTMSF
ncbi:hypothetical protein Pmani_036198 [Petrolisthes manimaculis]|uniref:Uncharacterized protein n=1 Tax=Petrolisthes manimaculis TaxID=1843537 RepID=A0AAE1TPM5_9EUCA|nr:hypothetical protein Pmani_036198 [Petrolisthes manimaculis]